jgi:hypothetical protein
MNGEGTEMKDTTMRRSANRSRTPGGATRSRAVTSAPVDAPRQLETARDCDTCRERGRPGVPADRDVSGTPMCRLCFEGHPGSEVEMLTTRVPARRAGGGRLPDGWPGGLRVVQATAKLEPGAALRFEVPVTVPVERARCGIYRAARLHGVRVSIARHGSELTVWRRTDGGQSRVKSRKLSRRGR